MLFRLIERWIDPYQSYDERADFPRRLVPFVLQFLGPAKGVLLASMALSAAFAAVETALAWYAGRLIDLFSAGTPEEVWKEHAGTFIFLALLVFLMRPAILIIESLITNQGFFSQMAALVRWRTHRKMLRQSLSFFTDDFAGRLANKQLQLAPALNDSVHTLTQELWYFAAFLVTRQRCWPRRTGAC